jgi:hypothetical protein
VMQVCFGNKDKVLSHEAFELSARLPEGNSSTSKVDFLLSKVVVPRGSVRMRLVVRDAISAHIGTIDIVIP